MTKEKVVTIEELDKTAKAMEKKMTEFLEQWDRYVNPQKYQVKGTDDSGFPIVERVK